jgi:hypothetical protein
MKDSKIMKRWEAKEKDDMKLYNTHVTKKWYERYGKIVKRQNKLFLNPKVKNSYFITFERFIENEITKTHMILKTSENNESVTFLFDNENNYISLKMSEKLNIPGVWSNEMIQLTIKLKEEIERI